MNQQVYRGTSHGWTLIDNDVLLPHNCARHFLGDRAVGTNKAQTMAQVEKITLNYPAIAEFIPAAVLHPRGASTHPSSDDLRAYGWLTSHMHAEALPGIMLIIGDRREIRLVSAEPGSPRTVPKIKTKARVLAGGRS